MTRALRPWPVVVVLLASVLGAAGGSGTAAQSKGGARAPIVPVAQRAPGPHVVVIVMENKEWGRVIGAAAAPFLTRFAKAYDTAPRGFGVRHPSLPNYTAWDATQERLCRPYGWAQS